MVIHASLKRSEMISKMKLISLTAASVCVGALIIDIVDNNWAGAALMGALAVLDFGIFLYEVITNRS